MSVTEIEKLAFDLAEAERASLAEQLLSRCVLSETMMTTECLKRCDVGVNCASDLKSRFPLKIWIGL